MQPKVRALDSSGTRNQRRFAEISKRQEVNPMGWSRKFLSLREMLEFRATRLPYGEPLKVAKIFISCSPGEYKAHLSVVEGRQYDGQSKLAAITAAPLKQYDIAKLTEFLGSDFKQHLGHPDQFACFEAPLQTQGKQDKLSLTLCPKVKERQIISRLLFGKGRCDPQQAIRPEPVMIAVDHNYHPLFVHPESLLRHTCKSAWDRYVVWHDALMIPNHWYSAREDLLLFPRGPADYKQCDNASGISVGAPPRMLDFDRGSAMASVGPYQLGGSGAAGLSGIKFLTSADRLAILHKRPIVL